MAEQDVIEAVLGVGTESTVGVLRAQREAIRAHAQGAYRELVVPTEPGGVTRGERMALARLVARLEGDAGLLGFLEGQPDGVESERMGVLLGYGEAVAMRPGSVGQGEIDRLTEAGLSPQDIVAVTQLAAFVPYQVRVLAGFRAMLGQAGAVVEAARAAAGPFTAAEVGWAPRIPPVEAATATAAQLAALEACPPAVRRSTYFLTLAQDPASLGERGALFNSVMYAPRGLPRAERELATAVVSMVNGCVYCTSVHARRFVELTKEAEVMQALLEQGFGAALDGRRRAIVGFAAKLTATPGAVGAEDLVPLRAAGLAELELLDLVHAIAMFANANRLMQSLGDSTPPA